MILLFELILLIALLAADIGSKYIVADALAAAGGSKAVIPDILTFVYAENTGASFGIFSGHPVLLSAVAIAASAGLLVFLIVFRKTHRVMRISLILIIAGALGNVYDRLALGYVRDFIQYTFLKTWFDYDFAICNIADVYLTVGAILLIIYVLFIYKDKAKIKPDAVCECSAEPEHISLRPFADSDTNDLIDGNVDFRSFAEGGEPYPEVKGEKSFKEPEKEPEIEIADEAVFGSGESAPAEKIHSDAVVVPETTFEDKNAEKMQIKIHSDAEVVPETTFEAKGAKKEKKAKAKMHSDAVVVPETTFEDKTAAKPAEISLSGYDVEPETSFEAAGIPLSEKPSSKKSGKSSK
jgi:signal peptidase II